MLFGFFMGNIAGLTVVIALLIVAAGVWGEILAVYALYQGRAQGPTSQAVLLSAMFLIVVVAAGPFTTLVASFGAQLVTRPKSRQPAKPPNRTSAELEKPQLETGKTEDTDTRK